MFSWYRLQTFLASIWRQSGEEWPRNQETEYCERPGAQCFFSSWAGSKLVILRELSWSACILAGSSDALTLHYLPHSFSSWLAEVGWSSRSLWGPEKAIEDIDLQPEIIAWKATHWRCSLRRTTQLSRGMLKSGSLKQHLSLPEWQEVPCSRLQSHLSLGLSLPWENLLLKLIWMGFHFLQQGISKEYPPQHNRKCENKRKKNNDQCIFRESFS